LISATQKQEKTTMNNILQSGKPYSIEKIFSGENNKVIIPDLQRDYCWGYPLSKDDSDTLVNSFLSTIFELEPHWDKDITMGLIYGYYDELTSYHLQLCDGQQRLTTLFLLLGVINRQLEDHPYRKILISDFELDRDDKEPHLLYSIRESSLYFLSDLTVRYFMEQNFPIEDIEKQFWFLNSYNVDPTIQSILKAIKTIEGRLEDCDAERLRKLGDFLIKHIKFLFYDMENRKNGEETFVVINTTGEPLSAAQNLKPKIIKAEINKDYKRIDSKDNPHSVAEDWEEMETWFWTKRRRNGIDTSTEGMLAFLHCVRILECKTEAEWHVNIDINNEKFDLDVKMLSIWEWFKAYSRIYETDFSRLNTPNVKYPENQSHYTQKELYSLLPTMVYCKKYPNATTDDLQRIYHLFYNMSKYRPTTRSAQNESLNVPPFQLCRIVEKMESKDVLSLLNVPEFKIDEERSKLSFIQEIKENLESRRQLEEFFAKAETGKIFNGEIKTLVEWSNFGIERFKQYAEIFNEVFVEPCDSHIDNVRRVLITYDLTNYPRCFTGYKNYSFGWKYEHWKKIITSNSEKIKHFFDDILSLNDMDNTEKYETIIKRNENNAWRNGRYAPFVYNPRLLSACGEKNVQLPHKNITILLQGERANNSTVNYNILINGEIFSQESENWDPWKLYGEHILYADHKKYDIAMDLIFEDKDCVKIRIFPRNNKYTIKKRRFDFEGFAGGGTGFTITEEEGRWYTDFFDAIDIRTKCHNIQNSIKSYLENK